MQAVYQRSYTVCLNIKANNFVFNAYKQQSNNELLAKKIIP